MLTGLFEHARFCPFSNVHKCFLFVEVCRFGQCLGERFSPMLTFFSLVSSCAFRDAPYSRFRCGDPNQCLPNFLKMLLLALLPNLHTCISLVEVYRFGQCLGERFSPLSTFFFLVSVCAFRDSHTRVFRCGNPKQNLPNFLKMLLLALLQIYASVFHLWKSIDLDSAWVRDSRTFQLSIL